MPLFYFTFGQKYRYEPHPTGGHPDGWFTVEAKDEDEARAKILADCGPKWAFQYEHKPSKETYPKGELKRL